MAQYIFNLKTASETVQPDIDGAYWYDTGTTNEDESVYYDRSQTYAYWSDGTGWYITAIADVGGTPTDYFYSESGDLVGFGAWREENSDTSEVVNSPLCTFSGAETMTVSELVGTETITSSGGTSTPVITAGTITFGAGTCYDLLLSNGSYYWLGEVSGTSAYDTVNGYTGTLSTDTVRTGTQDETAPFAENGGSKVISFNGTDAYAQVSKNLEYPFQLTVDVVEDGNLGVGIAETLLSVGDASEPYYLSIYYASSVPRILAYSPSGVTQITCSDVALGETCFRLEARSSSDIELFANDISIGSVSSDIGSINYSIIRWGASADSTPTAYFNSFIIQATADGATWSSKNAYGTTLPNSADSTGATDATLVNTEFVYIPALDDGTDDAAGLGITNPGGYVHNGGPHDLRLYGADYSQEDLIDGNYPDAVTATVDDDTSFITAFNGIVYVTVSDRTISEAWDFAEETIFNSLVDWLGNTEDVDCFRGYLPINEDGVLQVVNAWMINSGGTSGSFNIARTYGANGNWCSMLINGELTGVFENRTTAMNFCGSVDAWLKDTTNFNQIGNVNWCRLASLPNPPEELIILNQRFWRVNMPLEILYLTESDYS